MNMKNFKNLIILFIIISFQQIFAQDNRSELDAYFIRKMNNASVVGMQVGYLKPDGTSWSSAYGKIDHCNGEFVNDSTLFMIASCSKPVTALGILKLYNDGKLSLDQDINDYLPFQVKHYFFPEEVITVRMLLAHTAALKDNWDVLDPLYTIETGGDSPLPLPDFTRAYFTDEGKYYNAKANFIDNKPGQHWEYCNMGYALLGLIIQEVSGKAFAKYMYEDIFEPLGMHDSYWFLKDIPHQNIARPHKLPEKNAEDQSIKALKHYGFPDYPDGQLRTTVSDYLKFVQLILNEGKVNNQQFIKKEVIALFHTVQYPEVHKHQAIAWNYDEFDNWLYYTLMRRLPSHTGGDPGVATVVSYNPDNQTAAVVFLNTPPVTFRGGKIFYLDLVKRLFKEAAE